jgi:DNA-binding beta-propeller fold protein YncE
VKRVIRAFILLSLMGILSCGSVSLRAQDSSNVQGEAYGSFNSANSLAVDPLGNIYVLDVGVNKIIKLSPTGKQLAELGGYGWADQTFDHPYDVCAQNGLDIYVADYGNHRIQRFDRNLNFVSSFGATTPASEERIFGYPKSVAFSNSGSLFFVDGENKAVIKLTTANEIERSFGDFGSGKGKLEDPTRIRIDALDHVYVLDGKRIVVFDVYGNYIRTIGEGMFQNPSGMNVDQSMLYVLDSCTLFAINENGEIRGTTALAPQLPTGGSCPIRDLALSHDTLYILTEHALLLQRHPFESGNSRENR